MASKERRRRLIVLSAVAVIPLFFLVQNFIVNPPVQKTVIVETPESTSDEPLAIEELEKLIVRETDSKDGYSRDQFGNGWAKWNKCDTRQRILGRDLVDIIYDEDGCTVLSGVLHDPYTGTIINFTRGISTSSAVQIDHAVALANAWQTGAQYLDKTVRTQLANDDLELLAVDGPTNMQKGAADASVWLPPNKAFRCQYVARQIAVKIRYALWVTLSEHDAIASVLVTCPEQRLPTP
jgi:hypothetical protein